MSGARTEKNSDMDKDRSCNEAMNKRKMEETVESKLEAAGRNRNLSILGEKLEMLWEGIGSNKSYRIVYKVP